MKISEYQQWLRQYDMDRGFHHASPSHTFIHLIEEIGELGRLILYDEGYRDPSEKADLAGQIAEELADVTAFIFKLAYQYDVDLETALSGNMAKVEERYGIERGLADTKRYLAHQEENLRRMRGNT